MDKYELIGPTGFSQYSNYKKTMLRSWDKTYSSTARWYRRLGLKEDPWVSRWDHSGRHDEDVVLYGANSHSGHIDIVKNYDNQITRSHCD